LLSEKLTRLIQAKEIILKEEALKEQAEAPPSKFI
jgi:hypothetical protein